MKRIKISSYAPYKYVTLLMLCAFHTYSMQRYNYDEPRQQLSEILENTIPEKDKIADIQQLVLQHPHLKDFIAGYLFRNRASKNFSLLLSTGLFNPNNIINRAQQSLAFIITQEYVINNLEFENLKTIKAAKGTLSDKEIELLGNIINRLKNESLFNQNQLEEMYRRFENVQKLFKK